ADPAHAAEPRPQRGSSLPAEQRGPGGDAARRRCGAGPRRGSGPRRLRAGGREDLRPVRVPRSPGWRPWARARVLPARGRGARRTHLGRARRAPGLHVLCQAAPARVTAMADKARNVPLLTAPVASLLVGVLALVHAK